MEYVVIEAPQKVSIQKAQIPERKPGEALLRLLYGGVCGSDLGTYLGRFIYASYPRIPGHEFSAVIEEMDTADAERLHLHTGMVVTANPYFNCGECYVCRKGYINCCIKNETMGAQRDGAFRQYITMPVERLYDGKGLSPKLLAMVEPFCVSQHAVNQAQVQAGERVLVLGAGPIGMLSMFSAQMQGAHVTIADIDEKKLAFAKAHGADAVTCSTVEELRQAVETITGGEGFDVCIEAAGVPEAMENAVEAAAYHGRLVVVSVPKLHVNLMHSLIQKKELAIFGSRNALPQDFLYLIDKLSQDAALAERVQGLITGMYPFRKAGEAFEHYADTGTLHIKTMLDFTDSDGMNG